LLYVIDWQLKKRKFRNKVVFFIVGIIKQQVFKNDMFSKVEFSFCFSFEEISAAHSIGAKDEPLISGL
jgi:hypothetical protein